MGLIIKGLKVKLRQLEILHNISLEVKEGELVSLLGASGCGKSTLLKAVAGLVEVKEGSIIIDGTEVNNINPENRGSVIVFQDLRLFPHMNVAQNIAFPMKLRKVPKKEIEAKVQALLEDVYLEGFENRRISEISGGQMQRVALARAIAAKPKLLLLDEPFSGLDESLRLEMERLVLSLHKKMGITTILVTHDKREALYMSDKIVLMYEGSILQYGTPYDIYYNPNSKKTADYFGKANYIKGRIKSGIFSSESAVGNIVGNIKAGVGQYKDGIYEALIRPHNIQVIKDFGDYLVRDISFMGEAEEISIDTGQQIILASCAGGYTLNNKITVGSQVGLKVEKERISFLKAE